MEHDVWDRKYNSGKTTGQRLFSPRLHWHKRFLFIKDRNVQILYQQQLKSYLTDLSGQLLRFAWNYCKTADVFGAAFRAQSSSPTLLLGRPCDGVLEGFAAGVVSSTYSTFILLLRGAEHTIAAHFLCPDGWKVSFISPEQRLLSHCDTGRPPTSHSPRTHTLWGSLYEQRVPSRTTRSVRATARVSLDWQCRLQRLLAARQTQERRFLRWSWIEWAHLSLSERALSESAWLCASAWVSLELQEPPETEAVRPAQPEQNPLFTFMTNERDPESFCCCSDNNIIQKLKTRWVCNCLLP